MKNLRKCGKEKNLQYRLLSKLSGLIVKLSLTKQNPDVIAPHCSKIPLKMEKTDLFEKAEMSSCQLGRLFSLTSFLNTSDIWGGCLTMRGLEMHNCSVIYCELLWRVEPGRPRIQISPVKHKRPTHSFFFTRQVQKPP